MFARTLDGFTIAATKQINGGEDPPFFSLKQRTAQRKVLNDSRDLVSYYLFCDEIDVVVNWMNMTDIYETLDCNNDGGGRKEGGTAMKFMERRRK